MTQVFRKLKIILKVSFSLFFASVCAENIENLSDSKNIITKTRTHFKNHDYSSAIESIKDLAAQGNPEAQCLFGMILSQLTPPDLKAIDWLEKSATQNDCEAQYFLGAFYLEESFGVTVQNNEKAHYWLEKSAENNHPAAQFMIGLMYYKGDRIAKNYDRALYWFEKGAAQKHAGCQYQLGCMYCLGLSVEKNHEKAISYFRNAALQDDENAQFELGIMLTNGEGIEQDYSEAIHWFQKAANQGHIEAKQNLQLIYEKELIQRKERQQDESIQIKTEFYKADNIPEEFKNFSDGGDFTIITLEKWPKNSTVSISEKRLTGEPGKVYSIKSVEEQDLIQIVSSRGHIPGVPVTYTFTDSSKGMKEEITIIPNRLFAKSCSDNAQIEAKLIQVNPITYSLVFEGFGEDEEVILKSVLYENSRETKIICKTKSMKFIPEVHNKMGGIGRLSFTRSSGEAIKLEIPWGMEWLKYLQYYDHKGTARSILETAEFLKEHPKIAEYFNSKR